MPRKQQIAFRCGGSQSDDNSWDNEPRREERFTRIRARVPTGHPQLAKKLLQMRQELGEGEQGLIAQDSSQEEPENESQEERKKHSKSSKKSSSKRDKEKDREREKEKHKSSSSSKRKKHIVLESASSEAEPEVIVKTVKVSSKRPKETREARHEEVHIGRATVIDNEGDPSWEEDNRRQERFTRIRKRVPTGHPGLAKKVEMLRAAQLLDAASSDEDEHVEVIVRTTHEVSSAEETEASPPRKSKKSSSRVKSSSKKSAAKKPHFGDTRVAAEDASDSWDEDQRKEQRYTRIRTRVPTGHPGLATKVALLRKQMEAASTSGAETSSAASVSSEEVVRVKQTSKGRVRA